jgi:asparagine synthase (glutamine-hydrolysing)
MSGIAAIINFDGRPVEQGRIEAVTAVLSHRGPDGVTHWVRGSVALGHCMMGTTPEASEETQPLANEDESLVLVMDGWLGNWEELRAGLLARGVRLRSRSDAELVLRAFEVWGKECTSHLDGDFAFVVWNARARTAFCARDHTGNRPFYYRWEGQTLVVASEIRAVLEGMRQPRAFNEGVVAEYLAGEWYSVDETLWQGVLRLVAAHKMLVSANGATIECYWTPNLDETVPCKSDADYFEYYREVFADCVRRASRSNRPVAYEVSGGLDSSAVFCMAEHLRRSGRLPAPGIEGHTITYAPETGADERSYVAAVGEHLGVEIHGAEASHPPLSWYRERAQTWQDFPGFPNSATGDDFYREIAAKDIRVVLTGEGGDHCLTGSRMYYAEALAQGQWALLTSHINNDWRALGARETFAGFVRGGVIPLLPVSVRKLGKTATREVRSRLRRQTDMETAERSRHWLSPRLRALAEQRRQRHNAKESWPVSRSRAGQLPMLNNIYYPFGVLIMEQVERFGAHLGVELRSPMRSRKYIEFAFATPERLRLRGNRTKFIHTQALYGILPQKICERSDKADFGYTFRSNLALTATMFEELLSEIREDWVDKDELSRLYKIHQSRPFDDWTNWILWNAIVSSMINSGSSSDNS